MIPGILKEDDLLLQVVKSLIDLEKEKKQKQFYIQDIIERINSPELTMKNYDDRLALLTSSNIVKTERDTLKLSIDSHAKEEITKLCS